VQLTGISTNRSFGNINLALAKKFNAKSQIRFTVNNLLGTYKDWDIVNHRAFSFYLNAEYNFTPVMFRATYTYSFGSAKKSPRRNNAGSGDIENRIR
jgi:hypothetical protein